MQQDPQRHPQQSKQSGRNRCEDCQTNFNSPDELERHRNATHPESPVIHDESRNRENVPVE